jgi:hexosaminidase
MEPIMEMVDDRFTHHTLLGQSGMRLSHVSGLLCYIYPDEKLFKSLRPDHTLIIPITSSHFQLSRTDIFPNWYVVIPGAEPKIMLSTSGESQDFVTSFDRPQQWKRSKNDEHNPYTAFDRYNLSHDTEDMKRPGKFIIPSPEVIVLISSKPLVFDPSEWSVLNSDEFPTETNYLSG